MHHKVIPHPVLNGIIVPLPKNEIVAIPIDLAKREIHKKSLIFMLVTPASMQIISSGKNGKNSVKNNISFVLLDNIFSYLSTFSLLNIQYKTGFEQYLPIINAKTEPTNIPIDAKINAKTGPKIAVPASMVNVLGIGIKTTCKKFIIV